MKIAKMPEPAQFETLLQGPKESPVVMLNLLKFNEQAEGDEEGSGVDAYGRYAEKMRLIVEGAGGRFLWSGRADSQVIGESDVDFDVVALVEYPNREAFVKIASSPEVAKIGTHRSAGLAGQWLIACTEGGL
jgi:uncharacterized protein (DUF1330 family)